MFDHDQETRARQAAFDWLRTKLESGQPELSRAELESFEFEGERLKLIDQSRGIRNPKSFSATLSVLTTPKGRYKDEVVANGLFRYDYRRDDSADNVKLRRAAELAAPMIYFRGVRPKAFVAHYPVYAYDIPGEQAVLLALGEDLRAFGEPERMTAPQRSYVERLTRQRLHQPVFRAKVMHAYEDRCAVCSLRHVDLLDAAHIIPDRDELGRPEVSNGLALCKLHHAAYDRDVIGLSPDYTVHVNEAVMREVDGPMLRHGIQGMDGARFAVPERRADKPDRDGLARRYESFLAKS
ncbi:HNH endonuclease [Amnibacterium sp. CER49]|uniref:HNH endonuclease n=1 Tax=Amnibacterium sp. CER49 TaxID=3039161 RepID=UPI002449113E|nr:HNH endonuclease [Amnibacterium sp. CER49]MDH2444529.1 HNH endonuclease [Amnibacterium sp. CER49]